MLRCLLCLLALCVFCKTSYVSAQGSEQMAALPPDGFTFTGTWDCEGAMHAGVYKATLTGAVVIGGKWLKLSEEEVEPATGYVAEYLIGYDTQQKRLVEFDANNFGAAVYTSNEGWQNSVLTMTSAVDKTVKDKFAASRFVYTIVEPDIFTVDWQISKTTTLEWTTSDHMTCKRAGFVPW